MSSDGADQGITAGRALGTILGGKPQPGDDEKQTTEQMEARIRAAPLPLDGEPIFQREDDDSYSLATDSLSHAFLILADEDPSILSQERVYTEDDLKNADEHTRETLLGKPRDPSEAVWSAMQERWPGADDWIGGASGFMVGFAFNAARTIKGIQSAANPAIMTVGPSDA